MQLNYTPRLAFLIMCTCVVGCACLHVHGFGGPKLMPGSSLEFSPLYSLSWELSLELGSL